VYVSWNGATSVARWQLLAGDGTGRLKAIDSVADRAFETRVDAASTKAEFQVRALSSSGRVLGRSAVVAAQ
jgi:hypothetical protein